MIATCEQCANELDAHGNCNYCMFQLGVSQRGESPEQQAPGMPALPSIEVLNRQFPQLEISRLVGRGGMGAIYQARQTTLDREVALKLIASEVAADPAFSERFEREAKTLAKLSHPHIVTVYDFGRTDDGQAYLVMEYVDGINLREAINTQSVGHEDALEIVSTICGALEYAHRKGVVHRDIKPENILLGEDGTLKVADFGIAKIIDDVRSPTLTATRQVLGSLHYLAPEHLEAPREVDHRVDLYALGVVFYELLTGQLPLGRYEPPSSVKKSLDERIDRIVLKTLDRKPKNRYQSAAEIGSDLLEISQSPGVAAQANAQAERPARSVGAERANSVPFTSEAMGGLAEAAGILHVREGCLSAEYRIRDALWGNFKSKTHVVDIPTARIASFDLISGFLGNKIVLVSDSIRALGELPNSETGRVEFKIKKGDVPLATQVVSGLGFGAAIGQTELEDRMADQEEEGSRWTLLAILMLLLGLLNGGGLAILEIMINTQIRDEVEQISLAIISAVMIGPIAVLQLITGKLSLVTRPYALAKAASIVSMLPLTPAFLIGIPTGFWARRWLANRRPRRADSASSVAAHAATPMSQGWGATTMMYIRETRWGKMVAAGNVILAVGALLLFLMISQGYFSRQLEYRIVDSTVAADELKEAIETRIGDMGKVSMDSFFDKLKSDRFTIRATSAQHRKIEQALKISSAVSLVWLAPASIDAEGQAEISQESGTAGSLLESGPSGTSAIELAQGTPVSQGLKTVERPLGLAFLTLGQPLEISPAEVASVGRDTSVHVTDESYFGPKLQIELSTQGREKLLGTIGGESVAGGIGLVVNGVIVGFAPTNEINGRQILIRYSDENDMSIEALIAAVRGPALPSELERLYD